MRRLDAAVNGLKRRHPELSAGTPSPVWQKLTLVTVAGSLAGAAIFVPAEIAAAVLTLLTCPFAFVIVLRGAALGALFTRQRGRARSARPRAGRDLPMYSLLIPLYKEAAVVQDLINGLSCLDYPHNRLDILLIVERADSETRGALAAVELESCFRVVVVPDGHPRTKPRALNYALGFARGACVVVYDAEDLPEPDQLLKAVAALDGGGPRIGCVQARLDVHNAGEGWLTRQFSIEYAALFGAILPMLARLDLPIPLGGTSNHFPCETLREIGGWDPFNVTEDADLGIRLARLGWTVEILDSTTWEEAPVSFSVWLGQRTRWLKGWMQTYLVHMRQPRRLLRELGWKRFTGVQVLFGGIMLSALVHPWFYVLAAIDALDGRVLEAPRSGFAYTVQIVALFNLATGYLAAIALGVAAVLMRGRLVLALHAFFMPVYWLAISLAAYRALFQLVTAPFLWEKTEHKARTRFHKQLGRRPAQGDRRKQRA